MSSVGVAILQSVVEWQRKDEGGVCQFSPILPKNWLP